MAIRHAYRGAEFVAPFGVAADSVSWGEARRAQPLGELSRGFFADH